MARKRNYGQGTVYSYKTKSGETLYRWQVSLPIDPNNRQLGLKRYSGNGFATAREAEKAKRLAITDSENGRSPITDSPTFELYANDWLKTRKIVNSTRMGYEKILRVHLVPEFGKKKLNEITATSISAFYRKLEKDGSKSRYTPGEALSANTINKIHVVLGSILRLAVEENLLAQNPARHNRGLVNAPTGADIRDQQEELVTWTKDEIAAFLEWNSKVHNDDLFSLWRLYCWSGMRRGEATALKWKDINFDNAVVSIRRSSDSGARKAVKNSTKTRKNRTVALDLDTMQALKAHKEFRTLLGSDLVQGEAFVFGNLDGTVRNPGDVGARFSRAVAAAKTKMPELQEMTIKGLRHTHATLLLEAGVPAKVVQERLGHSNIQTTMNIYSHVSPNMQKDAVEQLRKLFSND
jgi:integrase